MDAQFQLSARDDSVLPILSGGAMDFFYLKEWVRSLFKQRRTSLRHEPEPAIEFLSDHKPSASEAPHAELVREIAIPPDAVDRVAAALEASYAESLSQPDFLGLAAAAGSQAREAVRGGDYNKAWGLYQDQKNLYLQHANHSGFTARHAIALDASIHQQMANVLRLEGRHTEALTHILYWAAGTSTRPVKAHESKVRAYFNRCKLTNTTLDEVHAYLSSRRGPASYSAVQKQVKRWAAKG